MKEIIIDETFSLFVDGEVHNNIKYHLKDTKIKGEYEVISVKSLTQEEMIQAIQKEIYGCMCGVDLSSEKDSTAFTIHVNIDETTKMDDVVKKLKDLKKSRRAGTIG